MKALKFTIVRFSDEDINGNAIPNSDLLFLIRELCWYHKDFIMADSNLYVMCANNDEKLEGILNYVLSSDEKRTFASFGEEVELDCSIVQKKRIM